MKEKCTFEELFIENKSKNDYIEKYSGDDRKLRYLLWKEVNKSNPKGTLIVIGIYPATATLEKSDNTITRVKKFADLLGYSSFIMMNLCPYRKEYLERKDAILGEEILNENIKAFEYLLKEIKGKIKICASWGDAIKERKEYLNSLLSIRNCFSEYNFAWIHLGKETNDNNPRNLSRLPYENYKIEESFDIDLYINSLIK